MANCNERIRKQKGASQPYFPLNANVHAKNGNPNIRIYKLQSMHDTIEYKNIKYFSIICEIYQIISFNFITAQAS